MKKPSARFTKLSTAQRERLLGYLEQKPRLGPETVHIDITNNCNLDCVTCWNYAPGLTTPKSAAWKATRMEAPTFARVLAEVDAAGAERIIISGGGEPFTHPDIYDFIAAVKGRGLVLTIITNGTLCDFPRLAELGVDQLLLNVSSGSAASYVLYHPNQPEETFAELLAGVASVRGKVAVNMVQVINVLNAHELIAMVELAAELGARVSFKYGDTPPGTEVCALPSPRKLALLAAEIPAAAARAKELGVKHNLDAFENQVGSTLNRSSEEASRAARGQGARNAAPETYQADRRGGEYRATPPSGSAVASSELPPPCFSGYLYSRVYVDGRVFFCCEHIEVGHMDDGSFGKIWESPGYDKVRQRLHQGKGYPGCARCGKHDMNFTANKQLQAMLSEENP